MALIAFALSANAADCNSSYILTSQAAIQPNRPAGPVAWNGSVLAVARVIPNTPITLSTYDANLTPLTPERIVTTSSYGHTVRLISDGNKFALVFFTSSGTMAFQELASDGSPLGAERRIGPTHGVFNDQDLDATYNAALDLWEIVYNIPVGADLGIWVTSFHSKTAGPVTDTRLQIFVSTVQPLPRIAAMANGNIAISWYRQNNELTTYFIATYDPSLTFALNTVLGPTNVSAPLLTSSGNGFALLYQAPAAGNTTELRWIRFNASGAVTNTDARLLTGSGIDVLATALIWNALLNEWAVVYNDASLGLLVFPGDYRIRRLNASGALISDTLFIPDSLRSNIDGHYNAVTSGPAYYGSIDRFVSNVEGWDSYVVKHCPLDASLKAENVTPVPRQPFTFTASAGGGVAPYTYTWDFGDFTEQRHEQVFKHGYERTGTYTVTLTVTDSLGDKAVRTTTVTVVDTVRRRTARR
ncbi:MAG TPA: PKD domain-containing protein [Thermoanaerobaculia bacterium]|nr:PKD domain-containing protein [Thermoanaerobaculia bacterium]